MTDISLCVDAGRVKPSVFASELFMRGCGTTTAKTIVPPWTRGDFRGVFMPRCAATSSFFIEHEDDDDSKSSPFLS